MTVSSMLRTRGCEDGKMCLFNFVAPLITIESVLSSLEKGITELVTSPSSFSTMSRIRDVKATHGLYPLGSTKPRTISNTRRPPPDRERLGLLLLLPLVAAALDRNVLAGERRNGV